MKKIIITAIVVVAIIAVIAGYFVWKGSQSSSWGSSDTTTAPPQGVDGLAAIPINSTANIPTSATLALGTSQGTVTVNNFYTKAVGIDAETIILVNDPNYEITYDRTTSAFAVSVGNGVPPDSTNKGIANLIQILGVSEGDACKLTITPRPDFCPKS